MKPKSKEDLLWRLKVESEAFYGTSRAVKLVSLIILRQEFQFSNEDLQKYLERFEEVLEYYNQSNDYKALLNEWDEYFEQELGVRILWKRE